MNALGVKAKGYQSNAADFNEAQTFVDAVLADFEPSYITMLSELSKSDPDDNIVLESLNVLLVSVIGNELTRTRFRKQYMQRLLSTLDAAVKHKEQE